MKKFQTKTYLLKSPKLKPQREPLRFLFISDLHNKTFGQKNCRLLQEMEHLDPQGVLIGGDLLVAKPGYSMEVAMDFVRETARRFPVYYAPGNHEYRMRIYPEVYGDMYPRYRRVLDDAGVQILDNREVQIKIGENRICLYGFEMDREYYRKGRRQGVWEAIPGDVHDSSGSQSSSGRYLSGLGGGCDAVRSSARRNDAAGWTGGGESGF